ncbi:glycosyltransferase family 4 protein [archaeon]|nr:glycosyltransferase family 4 protein [archaeon]
MHIVTIAQYYPPDLGGSSTRAYNVAQGLVRNNEKVTVITAFPHYPHGCIPEEYHGKLYTREYDEGVDLIRTYMLPIESKGLLYRIITFVTFILSSLIGLLVLTDVDVVWAANPDIFSLIPGVLYKLRFNCPLIFNVDDLSIEDVNNLSVLSNTSITLQLATLATKTLYRGVDAVTPISPGYFNTIHRFGVPMNRIKLLRGGVDLDIFKQNNHQPQEKFRIAYSGSFSIAYDFQQILAVAKELEDENIEFVIQGKGEQASLIRDTIHRKKLSNVTLIDEIFTRKEVSEFLSHASALILPLKDFTVPYPGISSKLYEYQALGKPIICCSEGQSALYVEETGSGLTLKPGDTAALKDAVLYLRDNHEASQRMGLSGRKYVADNVGINQIGAQMQQIMTQTISECLA